MQRGEVPCFSTHCDSWAETLIPMFPPPAKKNPKKEQLLKIIKKREGLNSSLLQEETCGSSHEVSPLWCPEGSHGGRGSKQLSAALQGTSQSMFLGPSPPSENIHSKNRPSTCLLSQVPELWLFFLQATCGLSSGTTSMT